MPGDATILELRSLTKQFSLGGETLDILRDLSLTMAPGDALAITGPSGCGKSTLLHLIGTLERPTGGTVEIEGRDPFALGDAELARFRNETIGFVFQEHHLLPQYTVLENAVIPALAFPTDVGKARDRATELLDRVGLSHRLSHRPAELSGGERQRVAVARALLNRPRVVLCDEPTGNLDERAATTVADLLFELHGEEPRALICVTHSLELAARFPRRGELRNGGLVEA